VNGFGLTFALTGTNWSDPAPDILAAKSPVTMTDSFNTTQRFHCLRVSQSFWSSGFASACHQPAED
jgi:hypothetical protein